MCKEGYARCPPSESLRIEEFAEAIDVLFPRKRGQSMQSIVSQSTKGGLDEQKGGAKIRTCSAALVRPESRRGTCRTLQLRRARGACHPCRPHVQRQGRPQPPRETRFAAAACARRRRRPERARASTVCVHNARAVVLTQTASR